MDGLSVAVSVHDCPPAGSAGLVVHHELASVVVTCEWGAAL